MANGYVFGALHRVRTEPPWNIRKLHGNRSFAEPRGQLIAEAGGTTVDARSRTWT